MKRFSITFFLLFLVIIIFAESFVVSAAEITCAQKDVNDDGKIDILDLIAVRGNLNQDSDDTNFKSDVNRDYKVNILDLIAVRNSLNQKCPQSQGIIVNEVPGFDCQASFCDNNNYETNEGPGGTYCCAGASGTGADYEECADYFTKSTASVSKVGSKTDVCKDSNILREAFIDCEWWADDDVNFYEKDCNDFDGDGGWVYYCTSDQVRKKERDFGCSGGRCASIGWKNDQLVSQNGDDSYCKDRKNNGCSLCTHNQYDCDADSECSGSLVCKGPTGGAADGCCFSGETWDTSQMKCVQCTGGVCCDDNGQFRSDTYVCDSFVSGSKQYSCWDGNCLDDNVMARHRKQFCSGTSSSCTGTKEWVQYNDENCLSSQFCSGSISWGTTKPSCKTAQCTSGDCCDTTCGVYSFRPTSYPCITGLAWYGCPWGENLGSDVGKKVGNRYCNGFQTACNGGWTWGAWSIKQDCSQTQYCTGTEGPNELWCMTIACSEDSDCGGCSYNYFCQNNDKWQEATCNKCNSPGTKSSFCSQVVGKQQFYRECEDSIFGTWSNYCKGTEVWRKRTNQIKGCDNSDCFSRTETQDEKVKACTKGCANGACNEDTCTNDCTLGQLRCSGNYKQTCGNYDADVCNEWPASTSGSGNELCQYGCANNACKPNPITCTKNSDCGTDAWTGGAFCSSGDVFQKWRTYTCNSPGTTSSSCTYSDSDKKKEDCDYALGCTNGACELTNIGRINLKAGNNVFSVPRKSDDVTFNDIFSLGDTNCEIVYENSHYDLAYFVPADSTSTSNYVYMDYHNILFPGQGYFIKVKNDCYINIDGEKILSSELGYWESGFSGNGLRTGWNLIGAPSIATTFGAGTCQLYDNVGILKYGYNVNSCSQVSGWNGAYQDCNIQNGISRCKCSVNSFEPGLGYWIRTKNDCKLG